MTPLTPAGQDPWDELLADLPNVGPDVAEALAGHRPAIERQAADRALAELRRAVNEGIGALSRAQVLALIDKASKP